jgi:hypothetical protein
VVSLEGLSFGIETFRGLEFSETIPSWVFWLSSTHPFYAL